MAFYREADVLRFLEECGCRFEGDRYPHGMGWITRDEMPFTLPDAEDGWLDADVVDLILADRWIWTGPSRLRQYSAQDQRIGN